MSRDRIFILVLAIAAAAMTAGCETAVDPFQPSDMYFSIGGVIDASAETQFVRLSPLRRSAVISPDPLDAVVTTTDLATGETAVWRDSVFALVPSGIAHNVWTTFDFEAGHTYRFEARSPEGNVSSAVVDLPEAVPEVVIQIPPFSSTAIINVLNVEKLADLRLIFCGRVAGSGLVERVDIPLIERVSEFQHGFTTRVEAFELARQNDIDQIYWIRVLAMGAGEEWPDFEDVDEETLALAETLSNVENGAGYLGGVTSRLAYWPGFTEPVDDVCYDLISRW